MEKEICEDIPEDETTEHTREISYRKKGSALTARLIDLRPRRFCSRISRCRASQSSGVILNPTPLSRRSQRATATVFLAKGETKTGWMCADRRQRFNACHSAKLKSICELVPTATLGYYSGTAQGKGDLCIYALNGKRFSGELPRKFLHSGNSVDLPAIMWMMKHPKPWVMVTDLGFCGGVFGSEIVAKALVERAVARGELTLYRSLDEAYAAFGGKGDLKN